MQKKLCYVFLGLCVALAAQAQLLPKRLMAVWPAGWEVQASQVKDNVLYEEAAQLREGKEIQHLQITAITPVQKTPLDDKSLRDFAKNLRDTVLKIASEKSIELKLFPSARGYYFSATDKTVKPNEYRQLVEGVMIAERCLVNFTLLTNDVNSADAKAMILALDNLSIR